MMDENIVPWGAIKTGLKPSEIQPNKELSGLASQGGVNPFPFNHIAEINNGIWHSDFPMPAIWMFRLNKILKPEDFYAVPQQGILLSWQSNQSSSDEILKHRSERFARVMTWCKEHYPNLSISDTNYLFEAFSQKGFNTDDPMAPFWQQAYTGRIDYEWPIPTSAPETREITFMFHPWSHAQKITTTKVPDGQWRQVSEWLSSTKDRLNWLKQQDKPVLLKIITSNENQPTNQRYMNTILGLRGKAFIYAERKFVFLTGEELLWLANLTQDFEIESAWVCDGWRFIEKHDELMEGNDLLSPHSVTRSLLALNRIIGMMTPSINKRHAPYPTSDMIWMRAKDRILSANVAIAMLNKGWFVVSHGEGWIKVAVTADQLRDPSRNQFLISQGILLPPTWIEQKDLNLLGTMGHINEYHMDLILKFLNPMAFIYIDRISLPWPGPRKEVVDRMQLAATELTNIYTKHPSVIVANDFKRKLLAQAKASVDKIKSS
jgi:hypothetical protein